MPDLRAGSAPVEARAVGATAHSARFLEPGGSIQSSRLAKCWVLKKKGIIEDTK